jgi:hypothetical protein
MSRKWKVVIGIAVALVALLGIGLSIGRAVRFRTGLCDGAWGPLQWQETEEAPGELEVELVDDDGDGVPDRGVIELPGLPREMAFGRECVFWGRLALSRSASGPGRGIRLKQHAFSPLRIVGGLVRLAFLAGAILLGAVLYGRRRKVQPQAPPASE